MAVKSTNAGSKRDENELPPPGSYTFIGPRNSGKTVFFVAAMEQLFRLVGDKKIKGCKLKVHYSTNTNQVLFTHNFITDTARLLREGTWPAQSVAAEHHVVRLTRKGFIHNSHEMLALSDYPGMAFDAAFTSRGAQIADPTGEIHRQANILRQEVRQAAGIFLTIDSERLYNGMGLNGFSSLFWDQLTCLAQFIDGNSDAAAVKASGYFDAALSLASRFIRMPSSLYTWLTTGQRKLAVLFTKSDQVPDDFDFKKELLEANPYVHAHLSQLKNVETRLFRVSAVPNIASDMGEQTPRDWAPNQSTGLTNAFAWMLGLEMPKDCLSPNADLGPL